MSPLAVNVQEGNLTVRPHRDAEYFRQPTRTNTTQLSDNWVLRFSSLKRLYRLLTQYFTDVLQKPTSGLEVPDLQAIAKDFNMSATLVLCRMTIAIAVQSEKNKEIIEKIQKLNEGAQHQLMKAIEQVRFREVCLVQHVQGGICTQVMEKINASQGDHAVGEAMTECVLSMHRLQHHVKNPGQRRPLLPDTVRT